MAKQVTIKGYAKSEHVELAKCAVKLAEQEELNVPDEIKFTAPLNGTKRLKGRCIHHKRDDIFKITIGLRNAKFVESEDGKYTQRKTGKHFKHVMGDWIEFRSVVHTMAHELAHLKFWNHGPQHIGYTTNLFKQLVAMLEEKDISIKCDPFKK